MMMEPLKPSLHWSNKLNYCCPVNFKTTKKYQLEALKIGLRAFFIKKQAPCLYIDISPSILTTEPQL